MYVFQLPRETACFMTVIKAEMGSESKQWGPDTAEWESMPDLFVGGTKYQAYPCELAAMLFN